LKKIKIGGIMCQLPDYTIGCTCGWRGYEDELVSENSVYERTLLVCPKCKNISGLFDIEKSKDKK
jgi:hypothetical protein